MSILRRMHRFTAWLACFAILLASLAPTAGFALVVSGIDAPLGELCSVAGAKKTSVEGGDSGSSSPSKRSGVLFKHCPFCHLQDSQAGLPAEPFTFFAAGRLERQAFKHHSSLHPQSVWTGGQPRGPPVFF